MLAKRLAEEQIGAIYGKNKLFFLIDDEARCFASSLTDALHPSLPKEDAGTNALYRHVDDTP